MKVLLSIKKEFTTKIFNGTKKYEFRRTIFKKSGVDTIVVYESGFGALVGEFEVDTILHNDIDKLWEITKDQAGISEKAFFGYFADKRIGYAIGIKKVKRYESPLPLAQFNLKLPPQSFRYL